MDKLDVESLFPRTRQQEVWRRARRFWTGKDGIGTLYTTCTTEVEYRQKEDARECVDNFLEVLRRESALPGMNIPAFFPDMGATMVASAFGGRVEPGEDGGVWLQPVIHEPGEVEDLSVPPVRTGRIAEGLRRYESVLDRTEGQVALRPPDMQGPLSTASLMWRQESFMMAMYDEPDAVHRLLDAVTDFLIDLIHHVRSTYDYVIEPFWPTIVMPPDIGCTITEDFMPLLPPGLYREFGLPYTTRMAEEFGGIFIHCCGDWMQHAEAVAEVPNLRGMDVSFPHTRPEVIYEKLPEEAVLSFGLSTKGAEQFPRFSEFLEWLLEDAPSERRFYFLLNDGDPEDLRRCVELIEDR